MSTYEWVIEHESADGVTTRIVFDFADEDEKDETGHASHHSTCNHGGSRYNGSAASHQRPRGGRGPRSFTSASAQNTSVAQQAQAGVTSSNTAGSGFVAFRDAPATTTRSEGGSSKPSSNGSRSRRHRHLRHGGSTGNGGGVSGSSSGGVMVASGSAYTSAALRQRCHRPLFSERGGAPAFPSTRLGPNGACLNAVNFYTRAPTGSSSGGSPPLSTLFMSAYGAELVEEEEPSSSSHAARRSRAGTTTTSGSCNITTTATANNGSISNAVGGVGVQGGAPAFNAPWAAYTAASAPSPTTHDPPQANFPASPVVGGKATEKEADEAYQSLARPSLQQSSEASVMDYIDDEGRQCCYVQRDVWAARATCPRTVATTTCDFPAFPPLHPIPLEEEEEEAVHGRGSPVPGDSGVVPREFALTSDGWREENSGLSMLRRNAVCASAASSPSLTVMQHQQQQQQPSQQLEAVDASEGAQRYNKMLLRKERQRGRGRGWQASSAAPTTSSVSAARGWASESSVNSRQQSCGHGYGNASGATNRSTVARRGHDRHLRYGSSQTEGCGRYGTGGDACSSSSSSSSSFDNGGADVEGDDDDSVSSIECLSNLSSSDDDVDVEALRADASFSARVQSLANRAGRERRKMEAREERQLQNEMARCEEALLTPPMVSMPDPPTTSPTSPPFSLASALRQRDNAFTTAGMQAMYGPAEDTRAGRSARSSNSNTRCTAPSSFFISPIHQSVAAESVTWAAGTRIQFLGHGGLGGGGSSGTTSSSSRGSTPAPVTNRRGGIVASDSVNRRRGRSDDDDDDNDEGEAPQLGAEDKSSEKHTTNTSSNARNSTRNAEERALSKSQTRRARKQRKKGDEACQSVVAECGGSRALRPVAAPSMAPPLELLPCSKKEMCEDMLDSFLMAAVLEDDDDLTLL